MILGIPDDEYLWLQRNSALHCDCCNQIPAGFMPVYVRRQSKRDNYNRCPVCLEGELFLLVSRNMEVREEWNPGEHPWEKGIKK